MKSATRIALIALVAVAASCGNDNNTTSNNTTSNNTTANNTTANNTSANNTTANNTTSANNTTANNPPNNTTPTRDEPYFSQFTYYVEDENALGTNREGFTVSVVDGQIANIDGNFVRMSTEDAAAFESAHLGLDTINAMKNGWGCREVTTGGDMGTADMGGDTGAGFVDESNFWFEARIVEAGSNRFVHEITGCVLDADPAVMDIINALEMLGQRYL